MRAVAFNAETARELARISQERKRQPTNKLERKRQKEDVLREFNVIVATAPSGGIASGAAEDCDVQSVDDDGVLTSAGYQQAVVNIFSSAVTADATIVAIRVDNRSGTGNSFIVISEDCP